MLCMIWNMSATCFFMASSSAASCACISFVPASSAYSVWITCFNIENLINVCKVQCTTSETGITRSLSTHDSVGVGCAYGKAYGRAPCLHVRERGCRAQGVGTVCNPQPSMLPTLPQPHDHIYLKGLSAQNVIWATEHPNRLRVVSNLSMDGRVRVSLGRGIQVEGDIRFHRAHVGHSPCPKLQHQHIRVCHLLRERWQYD